MKKLSMKISIVLWILLLLNFQFVRAQCADPTSMNVVVVAHETCNGNAVIAVGDVLPGLGANQTFLYQLVSASNAAVVIKPWQASDTFRTNIEAGTYKVQVQRECSQPIGQSGLFTQPNTVIVNDMTDLARISAVNVIRNAYCCNGQVEVIATGSGPLTYAIVSDNSPSATVISGPFTSNIIDNLCAGTHFVRVYDNCNGYATYSFVINSVVYPAPTLQVPRNNQYIAKYGCDSFVFSFVLQNLPVSSGSVATVWLEYPSGETDTIARTSNSSQRFEIPFSFEQLSSSPISGLPFPYNVGNTTKTFSIYVRDACGVVTTLTRFYNELVPNVDITLVNSINCDSVLYTFLYYYTQNGSPSGWQDALGKFANNTSGVYLNENSKYSLDGGVNWVTVISSGFNNTPIPMRLKRNETYDFVFASCGDTLRRTITTPALSGSNLIVPGVMQTNGSKHNCNKFDIATINVASNAISSHLTVEIISAPSSLNPIPAPVQIPKNGAPGNNIIFEDLPAGRYELRFTDSFGIDANCHTYINKLVFLQMGILSIDALEYNRLACKGNSGIWFRIPLGSGSNGRNVMVKVLQQPASNPIVPDTFRVSIPSASSAEIVQSIPQLASVPPGSYSFEITDSIGIVECTRQTSTSITITPQYVIDNRLLIRQACNSSLLVTQSDTFISGNAMSSGNGTYVAQLIDNTNAVVAVGTWVTNPPLGVRYAEFNAATINALPDANYTVRVTHSPRNSGILDCVTSELPWTKITTNVDPSSSIYVSGCDADANSTVIVGNAVGSVALPYSWSLYSPTFDINNLTLNRIAGPQGSNVFTGLNVNTSYVLVATDTCGISQPYFTQNSDLLRIKGYSDNASDCLGEEIILSVPFMNGSTYRWYKDGLPIGTNNDTLILSSFSASDIGIYRVDIDIVSQVVDSPNCSLSSMTFDLDADCTPLDVRLGEFSVVAENNNSRLKWNTYSESDNKGFYVQRSSNASDWDNLGFVHSKAANGNSKTELHYTYLDKLPTIDNFYRLKQVDKSGVVAYSEIQYVKFGLLSKISVYPNPASNELKVKGLVGNESIEVFDVMGRKVISKDVINTEMVLQVSSLVNGTYRIVVQSGSNIQVFPLTIIK